MSGNTSFSSLLDDVRLDEPFVLYSSIALSVGLLLAIFSLPRITNLLISQKSRADNDNGARAEKEERVLPPPKEPWLEDYAALTGVPPPNPVPEGFTIETAKARPYRPFRWEYHQTMCASHISLIMTRTRSESS
jgi:hypothetical protein